jgi:hypothetical protein
MKLVLGLLLAIAPRLDPALYSGLVQLLLLLPMFSLTSYRALLVSKSLYHRDISFVSRHCLSIDIMSSNANNHRLRLQRTEDTESIPQLTDRTSEVVDLDGLCESCASIPWERLADLSKEPPNALPRIHQTTKALDGSTCRVCRFLGNVITSRDIPLFSSKPPYQLKLKTKIATDNQNIGMLQFIQTTANAVWPFSRHDNLHVLVVQDRLHCENEAFQSRMIGGVPLGFLRHSIATCKREHGDRCSPKSPNILRNFKVFNCKTCEVVSAPPDCHYIALSYVWGSRAATTSSLDATLTPGDLPKTISDSCAIVRSLGYEYLWVDRYVSLHKV